MINNHKRNTFYVEGMHCQACELFVERKLSQIEGVTSVKAKLSQQNACVEFVSGTATDNFITKANDLLKDSEYRLTAAPVTAQPLNKNQLIQAFFIACLLVSGFVLLQKAGLVNVINAQTTTYPVVFLIGIVASLSSCMAVVGGLVLSISSTYAKSGHLHAIKPLTVFHLSRIVSFFILGAVIGFLGSTFTLTQTTLFLMNLILFIVMVILGVNLLEVFPGLRRFQLTLPKIGGQKLMQLQDNEHNDLLKPILLGSLTFFLPCGFTQSMQLYSLTTGNALSGGLTMLVFALGTLPILALLSFASVKLSKGLQSGLFFKTAGFVVLFFALFNFLSALAAVGVIKPLFSF